MTMQHEISTREICITFIHSSEDYFSDFVFQPPDGQIFQLTPFGYSDSTFRGEGMN